MISAPRAHRRPHAAVSAFPQRPPFAFTATAFDALILQNWKLTISLTKELAPAYRACKLCSQGLNHVGSGAWDLNQMVSWFLVGKDKEPLRGWSSN